ncbi:MAG: hypothetical protein ABI658_29075, partial [Acidimicrobiales bacterium]
VLLLADKEALTAEVAQHAATLDALSVGLSADTTSLDRAMTALHMYEAREAIEEVDEALARMEPDRAGPPLTAMRRVIQDAATS